MKLCRCDYLLIVMFIISLAIRLFNIDVPLMDLYSFRQIQCAMTVNEYVQHGVRVFDYITPVFGEDARIPFEFPLYQLSAYFVYRYCPFIDSVDLACRIAGLIWFYISAALLYKLALAIFEKKSIALSSLLFYLFLPYSIYWSRAAMIEYCAVALSLAYALFFIKWLARRGNALIYILALSFGSLAYMVKGTTVIAVAPILVYFAVRRFFILDGKVCLNEAISKRELFLGIVALAEPLLAGLAWVKYTDIVKINNGFFALSSKALIKWNYGTIEQRFEFERWRRFFARFTDLILPGLWYYLPVLTLTIPIKNAGREKANGLIMSAILIFSMLLPGFIFFNLYYVHDYYYIAITPIAALFSGFTAVLLYTELNKKTFALVAALLAVSLTVVPRYYIDSYFYRADEYFSYNPVLLAAKEVRATTEPSDRILFLDFDWGGDFQYYSRRNGATTKDVWFDNLRNKRFDFVVYKNKDNPILRRLGDIMVVKTVGDWKIAKISNN